MTSDKELNAYKEAYRKVVEAGMKYDKAQAAFEVAEKALNAAYHEREKLSTSLREKRNAANKAGDAVLTKLQEEA